MNIFQMKKKYPQSTLIINPKGTFFKSKKIYSYVEPGDVVKFVHTPVPDIDEDAISMIIYKDGEELNIGFVAKELTSEIINELEQWSGIVQDVKIPEKKNPVVDVVLEYLD